MRLALPPTLAPGGFAGHDSAAAVIDLTGETMGTTWSVRYAAPPRADAATVQAAIVARLAGLVAEMSHWAPQSLLSRFNRAAAGTWVRLPRDFAAVMARGLAIARETGGAFDPAIGSLVNLWGFGPHGTNDDHPHPSPASPSFPSPIGRGRERAARKGEGDKAGGEHASPSEWSLTTARATAGHRRLAWHAPLLRQPGGLHLDLSGIAKGHAVDAIADLLAAHDIAHCLVEIGGELVGRGIRPDGDPWWVDLESPPDLPLPPLRIALHGLAIATSGDYRRGAHTLDPRTGRSIDSGVVSCSVIRRTALDADAWATALTVLGPAGIALADERGIAARLVTLERGSPREHLSAALTAMLAD